MAWMFWALTLIFLLGGTFLVWKAGERVREFQPESELFPISVLKPLKGIDSGLSENIESFFRLDYPNFELIFSVADIDDPALPIVQGLRKKYPAVISRLVVGAENVGLNPKINNLTRSFRMAEHDLILISDSNVRVKADYLQRKVAKMKEGVGVVTSFVVGFEPLGLGAALEALYLNSFYARGMMLAFATGNPCVIGKSMLFRRSVALQFGGIRALGKYLAEDYALGEEIRRMGLRVELCDEGIEQYIGEYSVRNFWDRHVRWGRIRKAHAPAAFLFELLFTPFVSGLFAAFVLHSLTSFWIAYLGHIFLWASCDLFLMRRLTGRLALWMPLAWILRELLALPLWLTVASGNSVNWRGTRLVLAPGGEIMGKDSEWKSRNSSGEPLLVPTRLKATTCIVIGGDGSQRVALQEV